MELPLRRVLNVACSLWMAEFHPEHHERLSDLLDWPEEVAVRKETSAVAAQDSGVRQTFGGTNMEKAFEAAARARAAGLAEIASRDAQAASAGRRR
jgi:hypothetical protein